jgi:glycosyltransferase involved in cell wall biosynthesis
MNNQKILLLTPELPFPPVSGGKLKSWKLIEFLSSHYQLSVGCILKANDEDSLHDFIMACPIDKFYCRSVKRQRSIPNLIKSYIQKMPLNLYRTYSEEFKELISVEIHQYAMVIIDHYEMFQYIPAEYKGKVVLHEHNAYYLMWQRYAQNKKNPTLKRVVSYAESLRVRRYEKMACNQSDIVFASPNDIDSLIDLNISRDKFRYTYHLGDDKQLYLPELDYQQTGLSLLYVGSLGWEANVDGLIWFISEIWGQLKTKYPDLKFTIVGKDPDKRLIDLVKSHPDIELAGFAADLEDYFTTHRVFVAPLKYGAGMKVKVLNTMGRGMPVVTTSIGSEGIDIENKTHLMVADDNKQQIKAISQLLDDEVLWNKLRINSRKLIKSQYTWGRLFDDMKQQIDKVLLTGSNHLKTDSFIRSQHQQAVASFNKQNFQLIGN